MDGRKDGSAVLEPYDPMRLYARIVRGYKGGIRDADFATMDYRRFFGYVRELDIMLEEEAEANNAEPKSKNPQGEIQAALNQFPQPEEYTGETIQLI